MRSDPVVLVRESPGGGIVSKKQQTIKTPLQRMLWVDYARGMAILLVVYRHTMVGLNRAGYKVPGFLYYLQEFAVNFRMPVFFLLSGIFLAKAVEKYPISNLVKKKAMTLLYPYVLWTVILITIQIVLADYTNSERTVQDYRFIVAQPRNLDHMWYLLALFNTSLLFLFSFRWLKNYALINIVLGLSLHFASFFVRDYSLVSDPFYYYIFLVAGFLISKQLLSREEKNAVFFGKALLVVLPFFVAGQLLWLSQSPTLSLLFPFLAIILVACVFFYFLCRFLQKTGIASWLTLIGKYSLYIYILHILVISSFRILSVHILNITNIYFLIGGSFVLGVIIPVLAYRLLSRWGMWYLFSLEKPKKQF